MNKCCPICHTELLERSTLYCCPRHDIGDCSYDAHSMQQEIVNIGSTSESTPHRHAETADT